MSIVVLHNVFVALVKWFTGEEELLGISGLICEFLKSSLRLGSLGNGVGCLRLSVGLLSGGILVK